MGDLVFIGDAHLDEGDPALGAFLGLLESLAGSARRVVFAGDLFQLWIAHPALEGSHHRAVLGKLTELRGRGVSLGYLEGNRDYGIGARYRGVVFDDVASEGVEEPFGGHRIWAIHGDLANRADRRYRLWRRVSRSRVAWWLFHRLPAHRRRRLATTAEARLARSNAAFKRRFPEQEVSDYARSFLAAGRDVVVLGHFHVEKDLALGPPGPAGRLIVLPEWKPTRRHLRVRPGGEIGFVDAPV
jgi:UDP-2,3-diacylglucosamine hydrolase